MKQPRLKRIKRTAKGFFLPQYKGWLFWRTYRNPHNGHFERFCDEHLVKLFLEAKHYQDLQEIKNYNERGIYNWKPTE